MKTWQSTLAIALAVAVSAALAFDRPFPAGTKRGKMTPNAYPAIVLDGKMRVLSAGAKLWSADNLIEMPTSLRGKDYIVNYTENDVGEINRVWILTPEETRVPASALSKTTETR